MGCEVLEKIMAQGMKYPKDVPNQVAINVTGGHDVVTQHDEGVTVTRVVTDTLSDLAIIPYGGFWGVDEIMKTCLGCGPQLAVIRTLESYPSMAEAKAYIEGFMAGRKQRKNIEK